jgi:hypothetical protein
MIEKIEDYEAKLAAGIDAGERDAVEKARQTNTKLVIEWQGEMKLVTAEEWDELAKTKTRD